MFFLERLRAWRARREGLRTLQALDKEEAWSLKFSDTNPLARARLAIQVGDREEARRQWQEACERYPRFVQDSPDSLPILLNLRAFDEAEAFASRAYKRAPHNPLVAEGWAKVAQERGDLAEALRRWTAVWKRHRNHPPAYIGRASCLTGLDRFQEAEACISEGVKFFPQNLLCRIEHARVAECRKDWPAALIRWESVFEHHRHVSGEVGVARALLELDRFEEAEERLEAAMVRHPVAVEIPIGLANVASRRGDKRECAERWALVRARFPMIPFGYRGGVQVLKELGEFDEAAMVAREAIARFPQDAWALSLMKDLGPVSKIT